jgi:predicted cobalt transporter CbtA
LYIAILAISGFSALGLAFVYRKLRSAPNNKKRIIIPPLIYAAIMITTFLIMPPNPDEIAIPMDLVQDFRIASAFTMSVFWGLHGLIFGAFWDKFKPHAIAKVATA